jgi:hypothetical protein
MERLNETISFKDAELEKKQEEFNILSEEKDDENSRLTETIARLQEEVSENHIAKRTQESAEP